MVTRSTSSVYNLTAGFLDYQQKQNLKSTLAGVSAIQYLIMFLWRQMVKRRALIKDT